MLDREAGLRRASQAAVSFSHHHQSAEKITGLQDMLREVVKNFGNAPRGYQVAMDVDAIGLF